jgi:hypothetical protein
LATPPIGTRMTNQDILGIILGSVALLMFVTGILLAT